MDGFDSRDAVASARAFAEVVGDIERLGSNRGLPEAIAAYAAWIERSPGDPLLHAAFFNMAVELGRAGRAEEAAASYRRALAARPEFAPAAINLGLSLEHRGETEAALATWGRALQPDAARTSLLNQRARLLERTGRLAEAEQTLRASLLTDPRQQDAVQHFIHLRQRMCAWPTLDETIPGLSRADLMRWCGPLAVLALTDDVTEQATVGASWLAAKTKPAPERLSPAEGYAGHARIRLGYISSDFCRHALSLLAAELFERHDRDRFELFGYCASPEDGSDVRARVIAAFDRFTRIGALTEEAAARLIAADEIDVLVDLNGLTAGARPQILRWRPAPVQATYLGFVGPVPVEELDHLFCDDYVVPPASAHLYSPAPLAIGPLYQANDTRAAPACAPTRAEAGLPEGRLVFACFANGYKVTEAQFALWMEILRRSDGSVLWLAPDNVWAAANLRLRAAEAGVDPARLIFAERVGPAEYRARMALADLFLDTFPYASGTVASDAIRAGLPIVTLAGRSFASRMAARLLLAVGASDGIAETPEGYVEAALILAGDAAYRALFSEARWMAGIGDMAAFTSAYEATLLSISKTGAPSLAAPQPEALDPVA